MHIEEQTHTGRAGIDGVISCASSCVLTEVQHRWNLQVICIHHLR